jgi:uncharacterized membrane protein YraQ (UPF0718 family)
VSHILGIFNESLVLLYAMSPYLLFGFFFAGILHVFISLDWIARHLGKSSIGSVIKAVLLGIPLPLCSCGVIPAAIMLNKKGASRGAVTSFLIATPITGVDSIFATYSLMEKPADLSTLEGHDCCETGSEDACECECHRGAWYKIKELFRYAFVELLGDVWKWLVIGLLIGGLITYFVPQSFIENYLGSHIWSMLVMLVIGIPMYVCSTGSLPIAAALMLKGMSPGAAMVFLLAGPATNAVTITVVSKELGKGATIIYVLTIAVMSIVFGLALNEIWYTYGLSIRHLKPGMAMLPYWVEVASAIVFVVLIVNVVVRGFIKKEHSHHKKEHSHHTKDHSHHKKEHSHH